MDRKDTIDIHEHHLEPATHLAAEQLERADQIVASYSKNLTLETHHILVAAVLQAIATNFVTMRTR